MADKRIENFNELAISANRRLALEIAESGLDAIDTGRIMSDSIKLTGNNLSIQGKIFDLSKFKKIKVVGFGKASVDAARALEKILGPKITLGAVVGLSKADLKYIETFAGTHPMPSRANVEAGEKIYEIIKNSSEEDLIIVLVSGGGSALLCYSEDECRQGSALYDEFLKTGKTIKEMNTVRKHLSVLKGGGLAKIAYPATIVGLIFSDVPGDRFCDVASGPTYKDESTTADAFKIIAENNFGYFEFMETPKEDRYFEKVSNFVLVSAKTAVEAMAKRVEEVGLKAFIFSAEINDEVGVALKKIWEKRKENTAVLAAGEPRLEVKQSRGIGGRNLHMGLQAIQTGLVDEDSVFLSFASDGKDNSDASGAIVDKYTIEKAKKLGLDPADYLARFDSYNFFQKSGDIMMTGSTGANVSDLMILLTKKTIIV